MKEYRVEWLIDVDATSHEAAAEYAEMCMLDPTRMGNIFRVVERGTGAEQVVTLDNQEAYEETEK